LAAEKVNRELSPGFHLAAVGRGPQSGQPMSGRKSTHIGLERALFQSKPWMSLTGVSTQVYLLLASRVRKEEGHKGKWRTINNGELELTYKEAKARFEISSPRLARALSQLVEFGFVDVVHSGGGLTGGAYSKDKSLYGLSDRWRAWGTPAFKKASRPLGRPWPKTEPAHENVVLQRTDSCAEDLGRATETCAVPPDSDSEHEAVALRFRAPTIERQSL